MHLGISVNGYMLCYMNEKKGKGILKFLFCWIEKLGISDRVIDVQLGEKFQNGGKNRSQKLKGK